VRAVRIENIKSEGFLCFLLEGHESFSDYFFGCAQVRWSVVKYLKESEQQSIPTEIIRLKKQFGTKPWSYRQRGCSII